MDLDSSSGMDASTIMTMDSSGQRSLLADLESELSQMTEQICAQRISAQSQVLENNDLLGIIFASARRSSVNNKETSVSKDWAIRDLLWISLTCKSFYEPAINILWQSMNSWAPLLRLIPSVVESGGLFTTHGAILTEDLERFMFHAKLILQFDLIPERGLRNTLRMSPHLHALLAHHRRLENITFPVLQTLTVDLSSMRPDDIHFLFLLSSAALTRVQLKWANTVDGSMASAFLHALSQSSPALVSLDLEGCLTDNILDVKRVHAFKRLREVSINFGHEPTAQLPDLWSQLAHLQYLTTLSLIFSCGQYLGRLDMPCTFDSLETLNICGPTDSVVLVLRLIRASHLLKLDLSFKETSVARLEQLRNLLPSSLPDLPIQNVCVDAIIKFSPSVQSIKIVSQCSYSLIPNSLLSNFTLCLHLRQLSICLDLINFTFLDSLRSTQWKWANIKTLHFYPNLTPPKSPPLTLSSIEALVRLFPDLKCLTVPISFRMNTEKIKRMEARVSNGQHYTLRELRLTSVVQGPNSQRQKIPKKYSPEITDHNALLVASQFIDHLFPRLDVITAESWYVDPKWLKCLEKGVIAFQKARARGNRLGCTCGGGS